MSKELPSGEGVHVEKVDMVYESVKRIEAGLTQVIHTQGEHSTRLALLEDCRTNGESIGRIAQRAGWAKNLMELGKIAAILVGFVVVASKVTP
jgi:hypothetical protein